MNSDWSGGFVSFFKNGWTRIKDSEAVALAVRDAAAKIAEWASCLMGLYFTSAVAIAVGSVQVKTELPLMFHFLFLSILLGFFSLLFAEFVNFPYPFINQILYCLNLVFLMMAFIFAITIPFPVYFKIISLIVFLATLALIIWFATIRSIPT